MKVPAKTHVVDQENVGRRLDNYLLTIIKNAPKSYIYRIIRRGEVRVNGGRKKAETKLQLDDRVRVPPHQASSASDPVISQLWRRTLLEAVRFEDEDIVVLDKPAGISVHAGTDKDFGVIEILRAAIDPTVALVHRLDKDTSGCLLVAKRASICRHLQAQFRANAVKKTYRALLRGHFERQEIVTQARLSTQRVEAGQAKTRVDRSGKTALSRFRLIRNVGTGVHAGAYVEVSIETGRTHQIRVHAAHLGYPVCADTRYGDRAFNQHMIEKGATRLCLHAAELEFDHPTNGERFTASADEPPDLSKVLKNLSAREN